MPEVRARSIGGLNSLVRDTFCEIYGRGCRFLHRNMTEPARSARRHFRRVKAGGLPRSA